eukprot:m.202231 g.202231  ORF g.202231 m.202231 type:complete len:350 (-) comp18822_c0_seq1:550-1599(-)
MSFVYDKLPAPKQAPVDSSSQTGSKKRVAAENANVLPEGWSKVPSRSRPGKFTYENQYTKERIGWVPDVPASKTPRNLPKEPKREALKKLAEERKGTDPEVNRKQDIEKLKIVLDKLKGLLAHDDKFNLACKLLHKSLFSSVALSPETSMMYFETMRATQSNPQRVYTPGNRRYVREVFKVVRTKLEHFPKELRYRLVSWEMRSVIHNQLYTDDSFLYNKSAKVFLDALLEIEKYDKSKRRVRELEGTAADVGEMEPIPEDELNERKQVIVEILPTLEKQAKLPWAVSTVNNVVRQITDRRRLFNPEQQALIDAANDARAKGVSAAESRKEELQGSLMNARIIPRQRKF